MSFFKTFKDLLIKSLKENKKLIIILYALFIISFIISWIYVSDSATSIVQNIQNLQTTTPSPASADLNPIDLFIQNGGGGIFIYLSSIFFAIPALLTIIYNGLNLGTFGPIFSAMNANGGLQYVIYLLPHGIFEITGTVLQSVAGILLFRFIWRFLKSVIRGDNGEKLSAGESFEMNKKVLIQSLVILIFATILMVIAAPIEAYISVPFSELIVGH